MAAFRIRGVIAGLLAVLSFAAEVWAEEKVDFAREVKPILAASCHECHGAQKTKGKLRLDAKAVAINGGRSGKAIVPGKSGERLVYKRLVSEDVDERMPLDHPPLAAGQIEIIKKWIDQGAEWPDAVSAADAKIEKHWALVAPVRPKVPEVRGEWVKNDVDRFVLARLEKEKISPSPE